MRARVLHVHPAVFDNPAAARFRHPRLGGPINTLVDSTGRRLTRGAETGAGVSASRRKQRSRGRRPQLHTGGVQEAAVLHGTRPARRSGAVQKE